MKYEWRKREKELYLPSEKVVLVKVPKAKYFCIKGKGNPNNEDFANRISVLYTMSYAVKMILKGDYEYTVYPLESLWHLNDKGKGKKEINKDELLYTLMIKQPDFIDENTFLKALTIAKKKKATSLLDDIYLDEIEDGLSVQILHIGSYDEEDQSFNKMKAFISNHHLKIKSPIHREIYLSDARRTAKENLKTVLRYQVIEK